MCVIKQRLFDMFKQICGDRLVESPRAQFFRHVVNQNVFHSRLIDIIPCKSQRIALTRLVVNSHRLRVETGIWERPLFNMNQGYAICQCHKLEDEYHFLSECYRYAEIRARLIPRYCWFRESMYKYIQLLSSNNHETVQLLSKYVYLVFHTVF